MSTSRCSASATASIPKLFYTGDPLSFEPTIADVHTQATDEQGTPIGRVLHVATELPRAMVVAFDGCNGSPRAYVGLVSSYRERLTVGFQRLTDEDWAKELATRSARAPAWLASLSAEP